jgi:hypothetical protein
VNHRAGGYRRPCGPEGRCVDHVVPHDVQVDHIVPKNVEINIPRIVTPAPTTPEAAVR